MTHHHTAPDQDDVDSAGDALVAGIEAALASNTVAVIPGLLKELRAIDHERADDAYAAIELGAHLSGHAQLIPNSPEVA